VATDRGRDLKLSFLSDVDQFDVDQPARQLDDLADAATRAGRELDNVDGRAAARELDTVGTASRDAGGDLDKLAGDAKSTANRVDDAFDKIARSSRSNLRAKVGDDARKGMRDAEEATATFKDEARANLSEVASSFQGDMTSAVDLVQGTLGGIVADLGPIGAAVGAAGAAGLGLVAQSVMAARERVKELTGSFLELRKEGIDPAADSASHLVDELDAGDLSKFKRDADELGLSYQVLRAAFDGNAEAITVARNAIKRYNDENAAGNPMTGEQADLHERLTQKLNDTEQAYRNAGEASAFLGDKWSQQADAAEKATAALQEHTSAIDAFVDPVATYTQLLADKNAAEQKTAQATADATAKQSDSWEDYVKDVDVSVDEYLDALQKQVDAQEHWATNLQTLAKRGVDEGVLAELERMGPEGAPLVAKLTKASDAELSRMVSLYGRQGAAAGQAVASNLAGQSGQMSAAARRVHQAAAVQLARTITVPVNLANVTREAQLAWLETDRFFQQHPIQIRTTGRTGQRPVRDVP
jgi:chromosome segregation ATPase